MESTLYRILVMENESSSTQNICGMLENHQNSSFQIVLAKSGQGAVPSLVFESVDALLLDMHSLNAAGLARLRELHSQFNSLPILALVPVSDHALGHRVLEVGAAEYLVKENLNSELLQKSLKYAIERTRAEAAARQSEERFHELLENTKDILFTLDLEGNVTFLNKSAEDVLGWSRSEASQINIKSLVAPEHLNLCSQMMQRIVNEEPLQHFEISMLRKDGRKVLLQVSARLIYSNGRKEGVQGIARDVTERRHLENMVQQAQKLEAIGRLSGGLAHDFNNLFCVISGHAELMSERLESDHPAIRNLAQIKKAVDSASSLTRQLLAFSRKQVFHPRVLDLNGVVLETQKLMGRLIGGHIELFTSLNPQLGHVRVDPVQMEQVLLNLVLNARDAMPTSGRLTIATSNVDLEEGAKSKRAIVPAGNYVVLSVTDNGCGMDEETQSRIFEPFYTTKELGKGTGLGLASVYGIVKQSGGFIWVYSEPGQGTTIKVYLPRVDNPATPLPFENSRTEVRRGSETVLLVENAESLRTLAKEFLKSSGYAVLDAENGREALRIASAFAGTIHLLLTDVIMPGMGGKQLAEQVTSLRPATRVLFMSGYSTDGIVQSGILNSEAPLLEKPFTREILLRRVRQVLDEVEQVS
jgi:two-component system, cell cycle sensor histidine kinase and response regulator CckA